MLYLLLLYCKVSLLFRRGKRGGKKGAEKMPQSSVYEDIAGSQASASSSLAEAGDAAAVSAVCTMTGTNDNLKQPLVHLEQMSWGLNVLYSCVSSYCGGVEGFV